MDYAAIFRRMYLEHCQACADADVAPLTPEQRGGTRAAARQASPRRARYATLLGQWKTYAEHAAMSLSAAGRGDRSPVHLYEVPRESKAYP
jgi:hypothetical protein